MLETRPPSVAGRASAAAAGAPAQARADAGDGPPAAAAPQEGPERPDQLAADVARAVRELRANAGLSERAAARLLGTSQTQLRRMEDPRYLPSLRSLARLAAAFGQRLRIGFEPKERQPARSPKPPAARPHPAPRAKKTQAGKATRPSARGRRRA